jgi:hypothetical protein
VSIDDLITREVNKQIDEAIEEIPFTKKAYGSSEAKSKFQYDNLSDFILGYTYERIAERCAWYLMQQKQF